MVKLRPTKWGVTKSSPDYSARELIAQNAKRLGGVATNAFFEVKQLLSKEIPSTPSVSRLLESIPLIGTAKTKETASQKTNKTPEQKEMEKIKRLKQTVSKSHERLATSRSVFPFTLFPDDIILDRTKLTIVKRDFFWSSRTISIRIEDVLNVTAGAGPFFGSLEVAIRIMNSTDHYTVNYLPRRDAAFLKHIIQGYAIALHNEISTENMQKKELIDMLCELGTDSNL